MTRGARFRSPEVIQTSAMDCGPAALKCLLEGFGIDVSYGRLREACQTDVDGTSIDTLEDVANQLGLDAEQTMLPVDHFDALGGRALPALAIVRLPSGTTHFVVLWRRFGAFVEVMDPGTGRRFVTFARLVDELYIHAMPLAAADWRGWAEGDEFRDAVVARATALGMSAREGRELCERAAAEPGWRALAALDAALRMTASLHAAGGVQRGREARRIVMSLLASPAEIPDLYWAAVEAPPGDDSEERVVFRGMVLVRVNGAKAGAERGPLPAELRAALDEPSPRPGRELLSLLARDGVLAPAMLTAAVAAVTCGLLLEALLLFGFLGIGRELELGGQRLGAVGAMIVLAGGLLVLELGIAGGVARMGRRLEVRLRSAFLAKLPRLPDRYFRSRLTSDMSERSHSIHALRELTDRGSRIVRVVCELVLTTVALAWLFPGGAVIAIAGAAVVVVIPFAFRPVLVERDLRTRTLTGAISRFYFDALLGAIPIRTHGAETKVRREHESLLVDWCRSGFRFVGAMVTAESLSSLAGIAMAVALIGSYVAAAEASGTVLLMAYWALQVPMLGQELALLARETLYARNLALRLTEPLGAAEDDTRTADANAAESPVGEGGVRIELAGVTVRAGGHTILSEVDLAIEPGEHVGVVGVSGAGKSTLVGLLLGLHRPALGELRVDGTVLEGERIERLRSQTAWVDPGVQLWNRPLLDNLYFGTQPHQANALDTVVTAAELRGMLERLPDGLQTHLGESGARLSGGEGQRVRLGRALARPAPRLVLLDEPFRGLDRGRRRALLARAREWWRGATLVCVTHDVGDTRELDRVLVVEGGTIIEQGPPAELAARAESRYAALLAAEHAVQTGLWSGAQWRRLVLDQGRLRDVPEEGA